ncbi:TetR/AcrR family transcriptional regulator [Actinoplanes sp. NPDC051411]|uniref:TetR/AcrR family transcriptional regulator n=1 Tax=Actinoplanes sp. NPDC051411 TaxID=3155522 RepID=UPI00344A6589
MPRTRLTAAERSDQLIDAAITAFSLGGYAGTTTDQVARLAGVSQPYVIRIFRTKQELFIAAVGRACDRIEEIWRAVPDPSLHTLGHAYNELLANREMVTLLLHGFTASADPAIGEPVREGFGRLYDTVRELTGCTAEEARDFFGIGMLLTCLGAMRVVGPEAVEPRPWMSDLISTLGDGESA